jgi:hypothetical protein
MYMTTRGNGHEGAASCTPRDQIAHPPHKHLIIHTRVNSGEGLAILHFSDQLLLLTLPVCMFSLSALTRQHRKSLFWTSP